MLHTTRNFRTQEVTPRASLLVVPFDGFAEVVVVVACVRQDETSLSRKLGNLGGKGPSRLPTRGVRRSQQWPDRSRFSRGNHDFVTIPQHPTVITRKRPGGLQVCSARHAVSTAMLFVPPRSARGNHTLIDSHALSAAPTRSNGVPTFPPDALLQSAPGSTIAVKIRRARRKTIGAQPPQQLLASRPQNPILSRLSVTTIRLRDHHQNHHHPFGNHQRTSRPRPHTTLRRRLAHRQCNPDQLFQHRASCASRDHPWSSSWRSFRTHETKPRRKPRISSTRITGYPLKQAVLPNHWPARHRGPIRMAPSKHTTEPKNNTNTNTNTTNAAKTSGCPS